MDTNIVFDHLLHRKVRTPIGHQVLDLQELIGWCDGQGVRFSFLTKVAEEVDNGLTNAVWDEFGEAFSPYKLTRFEKQARKRWNALKEDSGMVDPPAPPESIAEARGFFKANPRQMTRTDKDSVPETGDLKILTQLKTVEQEAHFVTRDEHFIVYQDLIASKWKVNIHNGARLPLHLEEWRA